MSEFSKLTWLREARPHIRKLTTTQRDVLDVLFDHANADGTNSYRSQAQIAEAIGKSDRQVRDVLGQLRERGLIVRTAKGNKRLGHADVYKLGSPERAGHYRNSKASGNDLDYRNSRGSGNGSPEVPQDHRNSRGSGNDSDHRKSEAGLPEVSGVFTGSPALPPNRSFTPDPGPIDPEMVGGGKDDLQGESEPDPESVSSSLPGATAPLIFRGATDPFASLPSSSSAQGGSTPGEPEPAWVIKESKRLGWKAANDQWGPPPPFGNDVAPRAMSSADSWDPFADAPSTA